MANLKQSSYNEIRKSSLKIGGIPMAWVCIISSYQSWVASETP